MDELILFPLALSCTWRQQLAGAFSSWITQVPAQPAGNSSCLCCPCHLSLRFPLAPTGFANGLFLQVPCHFSL